MHPLLSLLVCHSLFLASHAIDPRIHNQKVPLQQPLETQDNSLRQKVQPIKYIPWNRDLQLALRDFDNKDKTKYNLSSLQQYHPESYRAGLHIQCPPAFGGLVNVHDQFLGCIRLAVAAGASGLEIPSIKKRGDNIVDLDTETHVPADYLFDTDALWLGTEEAFPWLKLYRVANDIPKYGSAKKSEVVFDISGVNGVANKDFPTKLDQFLQAQNLQATNDRPVIVRIKSHIFEWSPSVDTSEFNKQFDHLLRFRKDIRAFGWLLTQRVRHYNSASGLHKPATIDRASKSNSPRPSTNSAPELSTPYLALHLRTEVDVPSNWPQYNTHVEKAFEMLTYHKLSTIYVASGNETEIDRFRNDPRIASGNITVLTKRSLVVSEVEKRSVEDMSFDEAAEVDYVVLRHATYFVGNGVSSFSTRIAMEREGDVGGKLVHPGNKDGRSWLVGARFQCWKNIYPGV